MSKQHLSPRLNQLAASIAVIAGSLTLASTAHAVAPAAGSNISNIATASYTDGNGVAKTVTSNTVNTTVLQVSSFDLQSDRAVSVNPNGTATLSHTITNTGNGTDTFRLDIKQATDDDFDLTNVHIYIDSNGDGIPDNNTDLTGTTVTLTAGQSLNIVVVSTAPITQKEGQLAKYLLTVTAGLDGLARTNTDTVKITGGASLQIQKSASVSSIDDKGTIEYTLTYKNTGNGDALNVSIQDQLDPSKVIYTQGSGIWSGSSTPLTDAAGGDPAGINYQIDSTGKISIHLDNVAANTTGTIKFKVTPNPNNTGAISNTASIFQDDDADATTVPNGLTPTTSNTSTVTRTMSFTGSVNESASDPYTDSQKDLNNAAKDDIIKKTTTQGTPVIFGNNTSTTDQGPDLIVVHNTGNATETFNVTVDKSKLPAGSIVELFKSDGVTPLTDTNNDGVVDTGPISAGSTYQVVAKVTLPSNYSTSIDPSTADNLILTVSPVKNPTATDTITLSIIDVIKATVDISNGDGVDSTAGGPTPGSSGTDTGIPIDTKTVAPGTSATFPITVTNKSAIPDSFNLTNTLPQGWTVQYYVDADKDGKPDGPAITNTGTIQPGSSISIIAVVTPPANQAPTTQDIVITVKSPVTDLSDSLTDRVIVTEKRVLSLTADNVGQLAPGGTVTYNHTLTNNGTLVEGAQAGALPFTLTNSQINGWKTSVYVDLNNDGVADANELVTGNDLAAILSTYDGDKNGTKGLEPGQSVRLIVKVEAPATAVAGVSNSTVFTISPNATNAGTTTPALINTDVTTVNDGQVRLLKEQALDAACDGTADADFSQNTISAKPGQCVVYRITASNDGNLDVTNVVINDTTPAYTTFKAIAGLSPKVQNATIDISPEEGKTGTVKTQPNRLVPNSTSILQFVVKIDQ